MVARLSPARARRRWGAVALVVAVALLHALLAERWAAHVAAFAQQSSMPPRMEVSYVREMELAPPRVVAPAPPPPPRVKRLAEREAVVAALPASAPEPVAEAASAPEILPPLAEAEPPAPPAPPPFLFAASSPDNGVFEWPVSTRLRYVLTGNYGGEVHGQAQVEWIRAGDRYQVHLDVTVGPSFAPLATRRMSSDGVISSDGLVPERYDQETKLAFRDAYRATVGFRPGAVTLSGGQRRDAPPGVQDTASQFVQLSWMFASGRENLRAGNWVAVPLAMPRAVSMWYYDIEEAETVYTSFGEVEAFHLKPRRVAVAGGDLTTDIWIAPQLRHLPVRFRIRQDADNYVDLLLDRRPEMAAPEPPRSPP